MGALGDAPAILGAAVAPGAATLPWILCASRLVRSGI
jgi:hypothetical protein